MGLSDEVLCNHHLFGVHKGETHRTCDLNAGIPEETYEITPSGRLELLEYTVEDRSDPTLEGIMKLFGLMTPVFTGGRRDLNYHGWLKLSFFGRAKFTDGWLVGFEPEPNQPSESEEPEEVDDNPEDVEECVSAEGDSVLESAMEMTHRSELAVIAKRFRGADPPSWEELDAFVDLISPIMGSRLAWRLNKSLGLDANAIRKLLEDKSIEDGVAEDWLRFEQNSE
jgi:hypothetical protein